jgi:ribonucleoside-diphosphate reductase alpha chain
LTEKGFTTAEIEKLNAAARSAFEIAFIFNRFTLGDACMQRLGFTEEEYSDWSFNLLEAIGIYRGRNFSSQRLRLRNNDH